VAGSRHRPRRSGKRPVATAAGDGSFRHSLDGRPRDSGGCEAAGKHLEYVWSEFIGRIGFPEPDCTRAEKHKVDVFVGANYGLTGGADSLGRLGMRIGPGGARDRFGLAHELTHALQVGSGGAAEADPVEVLMRNQGWTNAQLNGGFADWVMHNAIIVGAIELQVLQLSCPLLSGPSNMTVWIKEGTTNTRQRRLTLSGKVFCPLKIAS
jgi:hypothetical protein